MKDVDQSKDEVNESVRYDKFWNSGFIKSVLLGVFINIVVIFFIFFD